MNEKSSDDSRIGCTIARAPRCNAVTCSTNATRSQAIATCHSGWATIARAKRATRRGCKVLASGAAPALMCFSVVDTANANAEARLRMITSDWVFTQLPHHRHSRAPGGAHSKMWSISVIRTYSPVVVLAERTVASIWTEGRRVAPEPSSERVAPCTIVFLHAHPDDESLLTGGTMARLAAEGHRVVLITATAGEHGLASRAVHAVGELGRQRLAELDAAAEILGVADVIQLGYADSGMADAPSGPTRGSRSQMSSTLRIAWQTFCGAFQQMPW